MICQIGLLRVVKGACGQPDMVRVVAGFGGCAKLFEDDTVCSNHLC